MSKRIVIIGSGLGGLTCGVILAKNGYDVTVLEQARQIGGCLQCFYRNKVKFETGMHFIGSADPGQTLNRMLRYLDIDKDIQLGRLDTSGYDIISLAGDRFRFANGREAFIQQMTSYFPKEHDNIVKYFDLIQKVSGASSLHTLDYAETDMVINTEYQRRGINEVLDSLFSDPLIKKVLVGNLPLYAAEKDKTPFAQHAFIMDFYNQSAFRVVGGSDIIAKSLTANIQRYGGQVLINRKVTSILCDDVKATGVEVEGDEFIPADIVISDVHPARTLEMLDTKIIRSAYRERIKAIPNTVSTFSLFLHFKEGAMPYMNSNFYGYSGDSPWGCENYDLNSWPKGYLYMHFCHKSNPIYAESGIILSYMKMADTDKWIGTKVGRRGEDYELFKKIKAERLLDAVEKDFPGIRDCISSYETASPLTYLDYTGTQDGSMYGVVKDINQGPAYRVSHKTKVPNLLLTGQNVNSHGMLGVLVGTVVTCSEILTAERVYKQIIQSGIDALI